VKPAAVSDKGDSDGGEEDEDEDDDDSSTDSDVTDTCRVCDKLVTSAADTVRCTSHCNSVFHRACVNQPATVTTETFKCSECNVLDCLSHTLPLLLLLLITMSCYIVNFVHLSHAYDSYILTECINGCLLNIFTASSFFSINFCFPSCLCILSKRINILKLFSASGILIF